MLSETHHLAADRQNEGKAEIQQFKRLLLRKQNQDKRKAGNSACVVMSEMKLMLPAVAAFDPVGR